MTTPPRKLSNYMYSSDPFYWLYRFMSDGRAGWNDYLQRHWKGYKLVVLFGEKEPVYFLEGECSVPPQSCGLVISLIDYKATPFGADQCPELLERYRMEVTLDSEPFLADLELNPLLFPRPGCGEIQMRLRDKTARRQNWLPLRQINDQVLLRRQLRQNG